MSGKVLTEEELQSLADQGVLLVNIDDEDLLATVKHIAELEAANATLARERDEARADAVRKGEALQGLVDSNSWDEHDGPTRLRWVARGNAALTDTTSEAWLAERLARARDEALEEAAKLFDETSMVDRENAKMVRALKRGGK